MDGLGACGFAGLDDVFDDQIGLIGRCRTNTNGLVGHLDMKGGLVGIGIDRNGFDAHFAG